ncbi:MAG: hypothetical protein LBF86_00500 [Helicobacteraceae bacterium]|jgi:hypothetical protein|nr:hypothetical protein [Helicobacteraceae bacterium]
MGYFNPLSAALGALWQKPLNYADTLRVNKGAEETSRPNGAEPKKKDGKPNAYRATKRNLYRADRYDRRSGKSIR